MNTYENPIQVRVSLSHNEAKAQNLSCEERRFSLKREKEIHFY